MLGVGDVMQLSALDHRVGKFFSLMGRDAMSEVGVRYPAKTMSFLESTFLFILRLFTRKIQAIVAIQYTCPPLVRKSDHLLSKFVSKSL